MIDEAYLVQGHIHKKGPNDSLIFFSLSCTNEIPLPNTGYHLYNCHSLTIPLVPQEESRRHSVSGHPGRVTRSRAEGRNSCSSNLSLNHSNMKLEVHRGRVPTPPSGHGRPQGTGPPVPAPADPAMYSFVQRFCHSDSAVGRAEHAHHQHRRVAGPAHRVNSKLVAIHRREDPQPGAATAANLGGVEGLLPLG